MGDLIGEIMADSFEYEVVELDEKQKAKLGKKIKEVREAMLEAQKEQDRELPFASGDTLRKTFTY